MLLWAHQRLNHPLPRELGQRLLKRLVELDKHESGADSNSGSMSSFPGGDDLSAGGPFKGWGAHSANDSKHLRSIHVLFGSLRSQGLVD